MSSSPAFLQTIEKTFAVLEAFTPSRPKLTLSDAARLTGMTRASARRILLTLESLGYLGVERREFFLRPSVLKPGFAYLSSLPWGLVALPHMKDLVVRFDESCSAAILDGADVVYVIKVPALRMNSVTLGLGARAPAFCTASGRVLLGSLEEGELDTFLEQADLRPFTQQTIVEPRRIKEAVATARDQGWAIAEQERLNGVHSVAAPLRNSQGEVFAALNISTNASRVTRERLVDELLPMLRQAAISISSGMAWGV